MLLAFVVMKRKRRPKRSNEEPSEEVGAASEAPSHTAKEVRRRVKAAREQVETEGAEQAGNFLLDEGLKDQAYDLFIEADLVERAAEGEEIVISKSGKPKAKLVPLDDVRPLRSPGKGSGMWHVEDDFDAPLPADTQAGFDGGET